MRKTLTLLAYLGLFIFVSCENQPGMLMGSAFKNMFNVTEWFSSADKEYEQLNKPAANSNENLISCNDQNGAIDFSQFQKVKDSLCQCKPWGSCDKGSCQCEILCPLNHEILNRNQSLNDANVVLNSMAFTNGDKAFYSKYDGYKGFCWGHASLTSKFNRLALFDASKPRAYSNPGEDRERSRYYKKVIDQVANNEPVDIPGFKNLYEFSKHPEVQALLMDKVGSEWSKYAGTFQGAKSVLDNSGVAGSESRNLVADIEERLKRNQQPSLLFNNKSEFGSAHVVLVSGVKYDKELRKKVICLRDNNFPAISHMNCGTKIAVDADGAMNYCKYQYDKEAKTYRDVCDEPVGNAQITHNENRDSVDQIKNLHTKCANDKDCPNKNNN